MNDKQYGLVFALLAAAILAGLTPATAALQNDARGLQALVDQQAATHGIPASFARAVVEVESNWNPQLTGAAGEVGLMQIKHETARFMGYEGTRQQLYDPATNIRWGMEYLAGAWKLAGGDHCGTVLRYQGGHGARTMTDAARAYCARLRKAMASL